MPGILALLVLWGSLHAPLHAQDPAAQAYARAVGMHYGLPPAEVQILADWRLPAEEIAVVLFLADRGGLSPDAVVALRRGGASWAAVVRRSGLDAAALHVRIDGPPGPLAAAYEAFASRAPAQWGALTLADADVVALVNLRVLADVLGAPPRTILDAYARAGSWPGAFVALSGR